MAEQSVYESENITMCTDGKYRWVYELNLYKNPAIVKEVCRVMLISLAIVMALVFIFVMIDTIGSFAEKLLFFAELAGIVLAVCLVITILGYLLYSCMMGGTYCALFEMDEDGVCNKIQDKHIKKAELIGAITMIAGLAGGRPGVIGTGVLASARTSMYTGFDDVKELEILPEKNLIRLNETLSRNQVYAENEDFAFVADYIKRRCRNAKIIKA
ncbi:MAG: hypothetical protein J6W55_06150 [Acidaminococcaceae bacterium]|nr:hypothetical protein [Acidaminococcaceae bacterium]